MDLDPSSFETMTPQEFARTVKKMSDREINELMKGEHRGLILEAIFARFPESFRPERAGGLSQVTQFRITGAPAGQPDDVHEVVIEDGTCVVSDEPGDDYDVSFMMAPAEFTKLLTGQGNPTMLVMRGKIKVRGDLGQAAKFPSYFDLPKG